MVIRILALALVLSGCGASTEGSVRAGCRGRLAGSWFAAETPETLACGDAAVKARRERLNEEIRMGAITRPFGPMWLGFPYAHFYQQSR